MRVQAGSQKARPSGVLRYIRWGASLILFAVGGVSLGYYGIEIISARQHQTELSRRFDEALKQAPAVSTRHANPTTTPAAPAVPAAITEVGMTTKHPGTSTAANDIPLGRIEVNSVGIVAMIEEGTASNTLLEAVGHILGTPLPGQRGNVGIAGHRDTFFRNLRNIHDGDEITLTTLGGAFRYRVVLISIVEPNDVTVLRNSQDSILTLVTCYPFSYVGFAPKRFIVRASLIDALPN
jgi:sortase A